ncbi:MAG TPA: arylesterase [Gemmatimonadaceae bacterium]|nr:arylesterase [Gemmatimonadaceae bacterium]
MTGTVLVGTLTMACGGNGASRDTASTTKPASPPESPAVVDSGPAGDGRRTVLFLGTSLTAGLGLDPDSAYPQRIQRKIDASRLPYQVVNAGVSGETSAGLLRRLDWVLRQPAAVIVVETGANDGLRGLAVSATRATIGNALSRIRREQPNASILLVQMEAPPNLGQEYTSEFRAMFADLAREHGATLMPFLLEGVAGVTRLNQGDGIHPNDAGERIVTDNVWRALQPMLTR